MIKKFSQIAISLLLLLMTVGLSVSLHYCDGSVYSVGVISEATNCCKFEEQASSRDVNHSHEGHEHCDFEKENGKGKKLPHCDDKLIIAKVEGNYLPVNQDNVIPEISSLVLFGFINNLLIYESLKNKFQVKEKIFEADISPPTIQQILSLLQTYLL